MTKAAGLVVRAERPDQPEVVALIRALDAHAMSLYPSESNHLLDVAKLCAPEVLFLVARLDADAVGCGAILRAARGWGEIKRMFVVEEMRGHGIGAQVLSMLERVGHDQGLRLFRLETGIHNTAALAAYRAAGYRNCKPFGDYAPDPLSVFMEKAIA